MRTQNINNHWTSLNCAIKIGRQMVSETFPFDKNQFFSDGIFILNWISEKNVHCGIISWKCFNTPISIILISIWPTKLFFLFLLVWNVYMVLLGLVLVCLQIQGSAVYMKNDLLRDFLIIRIIHAIVCRGRTAKVYLYSIASL